MSIFWFAKYQVNNIINMSVLDGRYYITKERMLFQN